MFQPKHVVRTTTEHIFELPRGATARDLTETLFIAAKVAAREGRTTKTDDWHTVRAGDGGGIEVVLAGAVSEEPYAAPRPQALAADDDELPEF